MGRGIHRMTTAQRDALWELAGRYRVPFREDDYAPAFDLPQGYVAGWVGGQFHCVRCSHRSAKLYVGVSPTGEISS